MERDSAVVGARKHHRVMASVESDVDPREGTLRPHVDEIVVTGITQSQGPKSDKRDAYALAEQLRVGSFDKTVFKAPREG